MPFDIYDFREDIRNVVITPTIRSRFLQMEPGAVAQRHSHDLGYEVFLILAGQCEFEIDGDIAVLGPGQMCFTRPDQMHQVRVIGDEPMTMYLSVTPHIEPTHSFWDADGNKLPPRYGGSTSRERAAAGLAQTESTASLVARQVVAAQALAVVTASAAESQAKAAEALKAAISRGDSVAAKSATDNLALEIERIHKSLDALGLIWNDVAVRASPTGE